METLGSITSPGSFHLNRQKLIPSSSNKSRRRKKRGATRGSGVSKKRVSQKKKSARRGRGIKKRRPKQKGGFLTNSLKKVADHGVDKVFNRLNVKDAKELADIVSASLINNALEIPSRKFKNFSKQSVDKLKNYGNAKIDSIASIVKKKLGGR